MTSEEFEQLREAWAEWLIAAGVPHERIQDCYLAAIAVHETSFSIVPAELVMAWKRMQSSDQKIQKQHLVTHQSCESCLHARQIGIKCPYHGDHYKIFESSSAKTAVP